MANQAVPELCHNQYHVGGRVASVPGDDAENKF